MKKHIQRKIKEMADERDSLGELSKYLNNDESDGHRLAEFLLEKKVGRTRRKRVLADFEPGRFSFDLQVVKLNTGGNQEKGEPKNVNQQQSDTQKQKLPENEENELKNAALKDKRITSPRRSVANRVQKSGGSVSDRLRRYSLKRLAGGSCRRLLNEFENTTTTPSAFLPNICSTPVSRRCSVASVRSPPENSSAPHVDLNNSSPLKSINENEPHDVNIESDKQQKNLDTILRTLQEMQSKTTTSAPTPPSAPPPATPPTNISGRSYIIEKGPMPGQVLLTPTVIPGKNNSTVTEQEMPKRKSVLSASRAVANTLKDFQDQQQSEGSEVRSTGVKNVEVPGTPLTNNTQARINNTKQHVEIPETQELPFNTELLIEQLRKTQTPTIVIPIHQTINGKTTPITGTNLTKTIVHSSKIQGNEKTNENICDSLRHERTNVEDKNEAESVQIQQMEDEPQLFDTIKNSYKNCTVESRHDTQCSNIALNLVNSTTGSASMRRLRSHAVTTQRPSLYHRDSSTRRMGESGPPKAHPLNLRSSTTRTRSSRRVVALNKAPGTPINGEKFAAEIKMQLARLTNYEILDLRKRNSLGIIFPVSEHKSTTQKEAAKEQQLQLEEEIQLEIFKRNMQELESDIINSNNDIVTAHDSNEYLPHVPDAFKDTLQRDSINPGNDISQNPEEDGCESFVDERSCDRVAFVQLNNSTTTGLKRKRKKSVPEVLQNYLNATKNFAKRRKIDKSKKRTLYSKGNSDTEDILTTSSSEISSPSAPIPTPPSPTTTNLTIIPVVSPPPISNKDLSNSFESFSTAVSQEEPLPPPLPFLDNISTHQSSIANTTKHTTKKTAQDVSTRRKKSINDDSTGKTTPDTNTINEPLFKKPQKPAPKTKRTKNSKKPSSVTNNSKQTTLDGEQADETQTLRRSKRGHVPLKNSWSFRSQDPTPLFQVLYREQMLKCYKQAEKRKEHQRLKSKLQISSASSQLVTLHESQTLPVASSTVNSHEKRSNPRNTKKVGRKRTQAVEVTKSAVERNQLKVTTARNTHELSDYIREESETEHMAPEHVEVEYTEPEHMEPIQMEHMEPIQMEHMEPIEMEHMEPIQMVHMEPEHAENDKNTKDKNKNKLSKRKKSKDSETALTERNSPTTKSNEVNQEVFDNFVEEDTPSETGRSLRSGSKKVRVRLQRLDMSKMTSNNSHNTEQAVETDQTSESANTNIIEYLKKLCHNEQSMGTDKLFKKMHCSSLGNILFTDLEGVEYAFYNTTTVGSIGYVRFKPGQFKQRHLAKKNSLHFIIMSGEFEFSTNGESGTFSQGDLVVINKGSFYSISNATSEVGLMIVIKM